MVTFGYNIDTASVSYEQALGAIKASSATHHLIMADPNSFYFGEGDIATIRKYLENAPPSVHFIWRCYNRNEGNWSIYPSAVEYRNHWAWLRSRLGDDNMNRIILDDPCNEPNLAGDNAAAARSYVNRTIDLVNAARSAGVKLAIGAWSVGTPHENLLETEYMPLWNALDDNVMAISWHLYGCIPPEAGELEPYSIILDAKNAASKMRFWPMDYRGWLIGRAFRVIDIFKRHNLGVPEIYVTECLVDQISDMGHETKSAWQTKYGIDAFQRDPRGIQAWEYYLKEMFPELAFDEAVAKLLAHARKNVLYHEAFKGACLFAMNKQWGYPNGAHKEAGSDYSHSQFDRFRASLLAEVNQRNLEEIPMPFPLYPATFHSLKTSYVRREAAFADNILYMLDGNAITGRIAKEGIEIPESVFTWLEIEFEHPATMQIVRGFIAKTKNLVIEYAPEMPSEPVFEVNLYELTIRGTAQEMGSYARVFEMLRDKFTNPRKLE